MKLSTVRKEMANLEAMRKQNKIEVTLTFEGQDATAFLDAWQRELNNHLKEGGPDEEWRGIDFESLMRMTMIMGSLWRYDETAEKWIEPTAEQKLIAFKSFGVGKTHERFNKN